MGQEAEVPEIANKQDPELMNKPAGSHIKINVLGDQQLTELWDQLKHSQQKSILISSFRQAARPLLQDAKNNLSARTKASSSGKLFKSLGTAPLRRLPVLKIGARTSGRFAGFAGHLLDDGTEKRSYWRKGKGVSVEHNTGRVRATHFWSDAVKSNEKGMVSGIQSRIIKSFDKLIVKYNNKAKT